MAKAARRNRRRRQQCPFALCAPSSSAAPDSGAGPRECHFCAPPHASGRRPQPDCCGLLGASQSDSIIFQGDLSRARLEQARRIAQHDNRWRLVSVSELTRQPRGRIQICAPTARAGRCLARALLPAPRCIRPTAAGQAPERRYATRPLAPPPACARQLAALEGPDGRQRVAAPATRNQTGARCLTPARGTQTIWRDLCTWLAPRH